MTRKITYQDLYSKDTKFFTSAGGFDPPALVLACMADGVCVLAEKDRYVDFSELSSLDICKAGVESGLWMEIPKDMAEFMTTDV